MCSVQIAAGGNAVALGKAVTLGAVVPVATQSKRNQVYLI